MRRRALAALVVLVLVLVACSPLAPVTRAEAGQKVAVPKCTVVINNGVVNPTATASCKVWPGNWYRLKATCWPGITMLGEWRRSGPSTNRCFLVNVTWAGFEWR